MAPGRSQAPVAIMSGMVRTRRCRQHEGRGSCDQLVAAPSSFVPDRRPTAIGGVNAGPLWCLLGAAGQGVETLAGRELLDRRQSHVELRQSVGVALGLFVQPLDGGERYAVPVD